MIVLPVFTLQPLVFSPCHFYGAVCWLLTIVLIELLLGLWLDQNLAVPFALASRSWNYRWHISIQFDSSNVPASTKVRRVFLIGIDALLLPSVWLCFWLRLVIRFPLPGRSLAFANFTADWFAALCVYRAVQRAYSLRGKCCALPLSCTWHGLLVLLLAATGFFCGFRCPLEPVGFCCGCYSLDLLVLFVSRFVMPINLRSTSTSNSYVSLYTVLVKLVRSWQLLFV